MPFPWPETCDLDWEAFWGRQCLVDVPHYLQRDVVATEVHACQCCACLDRFDELVYIGSQLHTGQVQMEDRGAEDESAHVVDEDLYVGLLHWCRLVVNHVVPA